MSGARGSQILMRVYLAIFFLYLFLPLAIMGAATFNASKFPTITPWLETTTRWFGVLAADSKMWDALINSLWVGAAVVAISVPVGTAAAMLLSGLQNRARSILYAFMVSPLLTPGVIVGISTLIFWNRGFDVQAGLHLAVLGQASFIIAYVMLLVMARLQRFDRSLEEAALDLGASHGQAFRRILVPHLRPALIAAGVLAFFQSFENYNTTLFTRGLENTVTVYIASRVRTGLDPSVNALGLILILVTVAGAVIYEILRRRELRRVQAGLSAAREAEARMETLSLEVAESRT